MIFMRCKFLIFVHKSFIMVILKSLNEQIQIEIEEGQDLILGRLAKCDLVIDDSSISSQHARLSYSNNLLRVEDLKSTNGSRLNYSLVSAPIHLQDGDTIEFGNLTFVVDGPELEAPHPYGSASPALTSLEPIEASQRLDDTMIALDISDEDLREPSPAPKKEDPNANPHLPVQLAFFLALLLILLGGGLLIMNVWNLPPQF
jgi:pSer/pThr/pTyr-binding forkhead associated (FHA) protein